MVAELVSLLRAKHQGATVPAESMTRETTIGDLMALPGTDASEPTPDADSETGVDTSSTYTGSTHTGGTVEDASWRIERFPEVLDLGKRLSLEHELDLRNPYFSLHERVINDTSVIGGRELLNFCSYNYLGMSGRPRRVARRPRRPSTATAPRSPPAAWSPARSRCTGSSSGARRRCSAPRTRSSWSSGHATNVTAIGHLVGPGDLSLHDALAHDSIMQGCRLSGARRRPFPHNDWQALDGLLRRVRASSTAACSIAVEGVYSMDGDIPTCRSSSRSRSGTRPCCMVDEAHSLGVLGAHRPRHRRALRRRPRATSTCGWGRCRKSLASCGGYIAGSARSWSST